MSAPRGHAGDTPPQYGTFIKTPLPSVVEILALSGMGFGIIDAEHAPIDRLAMDTMLLAGAALKFPLFVRVLEPSAGALLSALDLGAVGVVIPHVDDEHMAREYVSRCKYRGGTRGFSSSPRAAAYGTLSMEAAITRGDTAVVMCQIESPQAVANAHAIAAVPGVDVLFIGRADLALAMGFDGTARPEVDRAVDEVIAAARGAGKSVAVAVGTVRERDLYAARGADWIVIGSDQAFMRQGAVTARAA
jgi:2-keto-3-deoxy-L-rhamnonate aldolase RhmA